MGAVPLPPVSAIKKHQSFFKPWCKRFYALAYLLLWESQKRRLEPNILTLCSVAYCHTGCFRLPRFFCEWLRLCAESFLSHIYSAVSASGIRTPFLCARANPARAVFLYAMFIFPNLL